MAYSDDIIEKIMKEYDYDRTVSRAECEERVNKVHAKFPEIEEIEREADKAGLENMKRIIENPKKSAEFNCEFEKKVQEINEKKRKILKENNIPEDYDKVKHKCEMCGDTGFIGSEKCPCFVNKIIKYNYRMSNMENILHDFKEFNFDYYTDRKIADLNMTEKENMRSIYDAALKFCDGDEEKNLLFYGGCGVGKTFLSSCIAKRLMEKGKTVVYVTAVSLFSEYEDYKFGRRRTENFERTLDLIDNAELLIIDDMGAEAPTPIARQFFFDIVEKRMSSGKRMIISTNMTVRGLIKLYTERIESRIFESFKIFKFEAEDIRKQKLKMRNGEKNV